MNPVFAVFSQKNTFFKIEDKLSSKNRSPEIAVNYCKTVQVSVNHGWGVNSMDPEHALTEKQSVETVKIRAIWLKCVRANPEQVTKLAKLE